MLQESDMEKMYHVCKFCKYHNGYACTAPFFQPVLTDSIYQVAEDGGLSQVIEEILSESQPKELLNALENLLTSYKISKVRTKAIKQLVNDMLPEHNDPDLIQSLDENISRLYQERFENSAVIGEIKIENPDTFYCSEWR